MDKNMQELIRISREYGCNPEFVVAGGGNTSYKNTDQIWVKASGSSLADIDENGFVCLDREKLKILSSKQYSSDPAIREEEVKSDLNNAILHPKSKRPSVETSMHEIINYDFVVHTHPPLVNGLLCGMNSSKIVIDLFGNDALYVPYTDPGYVLFKKVEQAILEYTNSFDSQPKIIFLENHGVFVAANSVTEIENIYQSIFDKLALVAKQLPEIDNEICTSGLAVTIPLLLDKIKTMKLSVVCNSDALTINFVADANSFKWVDKPFTPDHIVYCKSKYLFIESIEEFIEAVNKFHADYGYMPRVIAIKGKGIVAMEESEKSAKTVLEVFRDMMKICFYSMDFGGPRHMTQEQIDFIDNWEVENYRRKVSKE